MIHTGDCVTVMATMDAESVDAVVTDPPYNLGFMGKAWDYRHQHEPWSREAYRLLKPGGHLLAFGGTRTVHRLASAIACELEGFRWIGIEREPEYVAIAEARLNGTQKGLGI